MPSFHNISRISYLNLFGDNINKIPRELKEVGASDTTFDSRVLLYNRVNPRSSLQRLFNVQSKVSKQGEKVVSIEPFRELGTWTTTKGNLFPTQADLQHSVPQPFYPYHVDNLGGNEYKYNFYDIFFNAQANPFIAKIETDFQIGATPTYATQSGIENSWQDLGVFETAPTESVLDIYFESSTSGLITDFNLAASDAVPGGISDGINKTALGQNIQYIQTEGLDSSTASPKDATLTLSLTDSTGGIITSSFTAQILQVLDGNGNNRNSDFTITQPTTTTFKIQSTSREVFLSDSNVRENYTFNLMFTDTSNPSNPLWTGPFPLQLNNCQLQNVAPTFTTQPTGNFGQPFYGITITLPLRTARIFDIVTGIATGGSVKAVNGTVDGSRNTEELVYEVVDALGSTNPNNGAADFEISQDSAGYFVKTIDNFWGIYPPENSPFAYYSYDLQLKVTDANGNGISTLSTNFVVSIVLEG